MDGWMQQKNNAYLLCLCRQLGTKGILCGLYLSVYGNILKI